jgi:multidrug efflux pump subunit AcrB
MNFSKFFIERPIFAAVLSLLIVAAGALALLQLPISEYPQVVPPTVVVRATYPGANPKVIAETVRRRWSSRSMESRTCSTCSRRRHPMAG